MMQQTGDGKLGGLSGALHAKGDCASAFFDAQRLAGREQPYDQRHGVGHPRWTPEVRVSYRAQFGEGLMERLGCWHRAVLPLWQAARHSHICSKAPDLRQPVNFLTHATYLSIQPCRNFRVSGFAMLPASSKKPSFTCR